jgi:hypothetical protein
MRLGLKFKACALKSSDDSVEMKALNLAFPFPSGGTWFRALEKNILTALRAGYQ